MSSAIECWLRNMVQELRHVPPTAGWSTDFPLTLSQHLESAADEIKRLRAELDRAFERPLESMR